MNRSTLTALIAEGLSRREIAQRTGLTVWEVRKALKREGLSTQRLKNEPGPGRPTKLSKAQTIRLIRQACAEELSQAQVAEQAGITDRTLRNAMARYGLEWSDQT